MIGSMISTSESNRCSERKGEESGWLREVRGETEESKGEVRDALAGHSAIGEGES